MKNLILILTILTISFSCKKQQKTIEPEPEPIQTSKSFIVDIKFTSDSLNQGYYISDNSHMARIVISLDTIPYPMATLNGLLSKSTASSGFIGSFTYTLYNYTLTSNNMSKPLTYYINAEETLHKVSGGVAIYKYSKQYTFHEGDNGTINFNTLP